MIWTRKVSKPVKVAEFSYDASLIASAGLYDRLVKIWRRLSFGSDDTRFDFTYLPHPTTVTDLHWSKPHHREHTTVNVLYTICADRKIRIWAATDPHGLQVLQFWAEIDMQISIQPRQIEAASQSTSRYAFFVHSQDFKQAAGRAIEANSQQDKEEHHALEHLVEVAERNPEICVLLDGYGNMSAWGLENVGCKTRNTTDIFNVAHVENFKFPFLPDVENHEDNVQFLNFCSEAPGSIFTLLVHRFDGSIAWLEGGLDDLFDPSPCENRLQQKSLWTGHDGAVKKIVRNGRGNALISRTNDNEGLIWKQESNTSGMILSQSSSLSSSEHIHRTFLLDEGDFVVNLHHHSVSLWDARRSVAIEVASCSYETHGKPLCLLLIPELDSNSRSTYLAAITSSSKGIIWEVRLPPKADKRVNDQDKCSPTVEKFCFFDLGLQENLAFVVPVDPAGSPSVVSGFLDTFAKDIAIAYTRSGVLRAWTARLNLAAGSVDWLVTWTVETGINNPSLTSGSLIRKAAVVDAARTGLTIWDARGAQLEYTAHYGVRDTIQDLDWSSTPDDQSILAVGFPHKVVILSQMRYDYLDAGPAWAPIREFYLKDSTPHPIGDSTWLGSGNLVIGAGNQLYVYDKHVATSDHMITDLVMPLHRHTSMDLFDMVTFLNGPLPVFHPQFLSQCILAGKIIQVQKVIIGLYKALKFFSAGEELDSFVSLSADDFLSDSTVSNKSSHELRISNKSRSFLTWHGRRCDHRTLTSLMTSNLRSCPRSWQPL